MPPGGRGAPPGGRPGRGGRGGFGAYQPFGGGRGGGRPYGGGGAPQPIPIPVIPPQQVQPGPVRPIPSAVANALAPIPQGTPGVTAPMVNLVQASTLLREFTLVGPGGNRAMALKEALTRVDHLLPDQRHVNQAYPELQGGREPTLDILNAIQLQLHGAWATAIQQVTGAGRQATPTPSPQPTPEPTPGPAAFGTTATTTTATTPAPAPAPAADPAAGGQQTTTATPAPAPAPPLGTATPAAFGQPHGAATSAPPADVADIAGAAGATPEASLTPAAQQTAGFEGGDEKSPEPAGTGSPEHADVPPLVGGREVSPTIEYYLPGTTATPGPAAHTGLPTLVKTPGPVSHISGAEQHGAQAMRERRVMSYNLSALEPSPESIQQFAQAPQADLRSQTYLPEIMIFYRELKQAGFDDSDIAFRLGRIAGIQIDSQDLKTKIDLSSAGGVGQLGILSAPRDAPVVSQGYTQLTTGSFGAKAFRDAKDRRLKNLAEKRQIDSNVTDAAKMQRAAAGELEAHRLNRARLENRARAGSTGILGEVRQSHAREQELEQMHDSYVNLHAIATTQREMVGHKIQEDEDMLRILGGKRDFSPVAFIGRRAKKHALDTGVVSEWESEAEDKRQLEKRYTAFQRGQAMMRKKHQRRQAHQEPVYVHQETDWDAPARQRGVIPASRAFGLPAHIPDPLTEAERLEEKRQIAEDESERVALGFLSPIDKDPTPMQRRAEKLVRLHRELDAPEEGQFLDTGGRAVESGAPEHMVHSIDWQSKTPTAWKKLLRSSTKKFATQGAKFAEVSKKSNRWTEPIRKVSGNRQRELLTTLLKAIREQQVDNTAARFLRSVARPPVDARFDVTWDKRAARGTALSPEQVKLFERIAKDLREKGTHYLSVDDMLPMLAASGEGVAERRLQKARKKDFIAADKVKEKMDETALDSARYEYAIEQLRLNPTKTRKARAAPKRKKGIVSKVKQIGQGRDSPLPAPQAKAQRRSRGDEPAIGRRPYDPAQIRAEAATPPAKRTRHSVASSPSPFGTSRFQRMHAQTLHRGHHTILRKEKSASPTPGYQS